MTTSPGSRARPESAGGQDSVPGPDRPRMPPVRLAPRDELAAAARVAPLLRAARDLSSWASDHPDVTARQVLSGRDARAAADALELTLDELDAAWQVVAAASRQEAEARSARAAAEALATERQAAAPPATPSEVTPSQVTPSQVTAPMGAEPLSTASAEAVLREWDGALAALLAAEDLDGLATALYTVGSPVRIDALFDAYAAAAGTRPAADPAATAASWTDPASHGDDEARLTPSADEAAALSHALETLADLGVVELGVVELNTGESGALTVTLSPLGIWGVHRRLLAQGWHVPVLGGADRDGAAGLLLTLASCDAEDGETKIGAWLAGRAPDRAAAELIDAAKSGSPGLRGAAFAVLDRIGDAAVAPVRGALAEPLLRAHAAVWLHEHGEEAELGPTERAWLLVDLGAGLLEEADPRDVVAELLPEVAPQAQADIVAGLWQVSHPGVIDLLTTLSEHHPDPRVARAARKAAFKARSARVSGSWRAS